MGNEQRRWGRAPPSCRTVIITTINPPVEAGLLPHSAVVKTVPLSFDGSFHEKGQLSEPIPIVR